MKKENTIKIEKIISSRYTRNGNRIWNIIVSIDGVSGLINYKSVDFNYITPKEGETNIRETKITTTGRKKLLIVLKI